MRREFLSEKQRRLQRKEGNEVSELHAKDKERVSELLVCHVKKKESITLSFPFFIHRKHRNPQNLMLRGKKGSKKSKKSKEEGA